jgi:hypothetical protein
MQHELKREIMDEINIYLTELVAQKRLSHREAELFLDYAYDLVLNNVNDGEIEPIITKEVTKHIEG